MIKGEICMKRVPIFFTFNNRYAVPGCVALYSLLDKAKKDVFYEMHVLSSDLTEASMNLISEKLSCFKNKTLTFTDIGDLKKEEYLNCNWNNSNKNLNKFPPETIVKCYAASLFPQYEKIIYSDVDVVFVDDISEVYDIDLQDCYCAGIKDLTFNDKIKKQGFDYAAENYLAAGFLVFNLDKMRKDNIEEKINETIYDDSISKFGLEQDTLTLAFGEKIKFLPLNYISFPYLYNDYVCNKELKLNYSREELYDSIINPKIIHYASVKPWAAEVQLSDIWWNIFYYLNLPKTEVFAPRYSAKKILFKNFTNGFMLILLNLPLVNNLLPTEFIKKQYKSIKKYIDEVLQRYK